MSRCYVIAAGDFTPEGLAPEPGDWVIAADAGYRHASRYGIPVDLAVGDFDSLGEAPKHSNIVKLHAEKDDSDTQHALDIALQRGYRDFRMYGMLGGRQDHAWANILLLGYLLDRGAHGRIVGEGVRIFAIRNESITLSPLESGIVSVFALGGEARGVTIEGLKYELRSRSFGRSPSHGLSNECIGKPARIAVDAATLLVFCPPGVRPRGGTEA